MTKTRRDEYVARAEAAEEQAEKAWNAKAREAWRRIAASYRDLAMVAQYYERKGSRPTKE